jgi:hypothetical protein
MKESLTFICFGLILGVLIGILIVPERVEIRVVEVPPGKQETNYFIESAYIGLGGLRAEMETKTWNGLITVETEYK